MPNVVRNPYSNTAGNVPPSLGNGVIAVNQSDGRLFYRAASGTVTTFSSIASYATSASFPATGASSSVLYLASDTSRLHQFVGGVYVEIGVAGSTPPHADTHATGGSDAITPASIGAAAASHTHTASQVSDFATEAAKYGPVVSVAGRTGTVTISSSDVSGLGSLATANSVTYASLTDTPASFTPSSHTHAASDIASGTIATARLGSGTADSTTYLRGDQTWATVSGGGSSSASDLSSGTLSQARLDFVPIHPFLLMGG